jgi:hypothetical protein
MEVGAGAMSVTREFARKILGTAVVVAAILWLVCYVTQVLVFMVQL